MFFWNSLAFSIRGQQKFFKHIHLFYAALGLSCCMQDLHCIMEIFHRSVQILSLQCMGFVARGILVPRPEIEPSSPVLQGEFLTTGPPVRSTNVWRMNQMFSGTPPHFSACLLICKMGAILFFLSTSQRSDELMDVKAPRRCKKSHPYLSSWNP